MMLQSASPYRLETGMVQDISGKSIKSRLELLSTLLFVSS